MFNGYIIVSYTACDFLYSYLSFASDLGRQL